MQQRTINHRRVTRLVKSVIDPEVYRELSHQWDLKHEPERVPENYKPRLPGVECDNLNGINRTFVTINDEFLTLIGYDDNLKGFLIDYFGNDYKPKEGEPLRFRFIDGVLINPTQPDPNHK